VKKTTRAEDRNRPLPLLDRLRLVLEHSHNRYTFEYRCHGLQIVIEKLPDKSVIAYYADDRNNRVIIDVTQAPFDRISYFLRFS
jgi:hypothetical protein